jgi:sugar transferase (PEP-CTERM/EpsH1 system associated)
MKTLLFLVHRIPYPPNKGDKIRSYHLLRFFAKHFRVALGAFVDSPDDWRHREELAPYCADLHLVGMNGAWARLRSLRGFFSNEPLTVPFYRDAAMAAWVRAKIAEGVDAAVVFSSSMAQYVIPFDDAKPRIIDFVDLDSEKWRQYGSTRGGILGAIYRREAKTLASYERKLASEFAASVFVSDAEPEPLVRSVPALASRIHAIGNGVDHRYFDPHTAMPDPFESQAKTVVFTGAMDYWANEDAVSWFATEVWGRVVAEEPGARFYIVGSRPTPAVRALERLHGVTVTGTVQDVRPYLKFAAVSVAPLRVARGIQNKVLEAMAMGLPVVATPAAGQGLSPAVRACIDVADDAATFAERVVSVLRRGASSVVAERNRGVVIAEYDWENSGRAWGRLLGVPDTGSVAGSGRGPEIGLRTA